MAETEDFTGWVPAGTPHYSGFQSFRPSYLGQTTYPEYETTGLIFSLIVYYYGVQSLLSDLAPRPHTPPWELMPHPDQYLFPDSQDGRGMWTGPGVVYYAC